MDNRLETRFQQKEFDATPKKILIEFFNYMDEKRCHYEEQIIDYKRKISEVETIITGLQNELKDPGELTVNAIKGINEYIKEQKNEIEKYKREIRLITINCDILWANEIKIDKIMGLGLED